MIKPWKLILSDTIGQFLYWNVPGAQPIMDRILNRRAGFNPTVDEQRELSIRLKLARGQGFITQPDGDFLFHRLDKARKTNGIN